MANGGISGPRVAHVAIDGIPPGTAEGKVRTPGRFRARSGIMIPVGWRAVVEVTVRAHHEGGFLHFRHPFRFDGDVRRHAGEGAVVIHPMDDRILMGRRGRAGLPGTKVPRPPHGGFRPANLFLLIKGDHLAPRKGVHGKALSRKKPRHKDKTPNEKPEFFTLTHYKYPS